ncbi:PAS domain-containing protein [Lichenifustis flavocetrariae]|uniref:histidine kinase n=1 Tax=Lichenifustis flavocetrariae TaxID=2949735 RepID=A0AA41YTH2_9HYPH|nr:PAS domain-containing protein [Lichenifustis flavocetrariae]MCW6506926.1 PAS domain-containing protein [Lichenifustis flavocetrariae]
MSLDGSKDDREQEADYRAEIARLKAELLARSSSTAAHVSAEIAGKDGGDDPFFAAVRATRMPMVVSNPRLPDNPIVFVNDSFCRLTGYPREEIVGRNCRFLQCAETDPAAVARIRAAVAAPEAIEIDIENARKDGTHFWNRLLMAPVHDAEGNLAYFFASQVDVSLERGRLAGLETHNAALMAEVAGRQRAQRESDDRLRFATEAGRLGVWDLDLRTMEMEASPRCNENFGRPQSAPFTYADLQAAVHPEDRERRQKAVERSVATGADYDIEYRVIRLDGSTGWVQIRAKAIMEADGRARRLVGVSLDITDRMVSDTRRRALVELGDVIRDKTDPDEIAFEAARILGEALGVSRAGYGTVDIEAETIRIERDWNAPGIKSLAGLLHFRDYGSYIEDLKRRETVVFADAETDPRTRDTADALKAISAQSVVNMPITEKGGLVALLYLNHAQARHWSDEELAFVREVAERTRVAVERRRVEQDLRELAASLERRVEERTRERDRAWKNSRDLQAVVGRDGIFLAVNEAWTTVLGWRPDQVVGRHHLEFNHDEHHSDSEAALNAAFDTGLPAYETRCRHADGSFRWISWVAASEDGLVYANGRDVTAEKEQAEALHRTEEQLRQAQKMEAVGQLTGGLAHDFNNLLTGVLGSLELMQTRLRQGRLGELEKYATTAQGAAKRAAALTHRLLAFSRRQTLAPKPTDVNRLVAEMAELIRRTVGPTIKLEVVGAGGLWKTLVDPPQLENALLNLAINARDAMPQGGQLTIETGNRWLDERGARERELKPGQYVSLCVSDTGTGMPADVVARAFDPFFTTKPIGMGTGLGLSMIYGFTKQTGGTVRIYSEVGHGTMVCLYLPRHYGNEAADEILLDRGDALPFAKGGTVLVVDDEPSVRMLVADVLGEAGCNAIEAEDGVAALKILESAVQIDLMVTDVGLPNGMNGRQVADAARALRPGLKILFITGYAENAVLGHGHLDAGMEVITKPFAMEVLGKRIGDLLANR